MLAEKVRYRQSKLLRDKSAATIAIEKRSNHGCLTCRDRHKKCDERKPNCSGCKENFLRCVWRDNEEVQDESHMFLNFHLNDWKVNKRRKRLEPALIMTQKRIFYSLTLSKNALAKFNEELGNLEELKRFPTAKQLDESEVAPQPAIDSSSSSLPFLDESTIWLSRQVTPHLTDSLTISNSSIEKAIERAEKGSAGDNTRLRALHFYSYLFDDSDPLAQKFESIFQSINNGEFDTIPSCCTDELFLLYISVKHWLLSVGPQETHPLLTTQATFTRNFESNPVLKEVFLCCGATFMEYYDSQIFSSLSTDLYQSSLMLIKKFLKDNSDEKHKPWLLASYQLLCLRNKTAINSTVNDCVSCLTNSYQIIKSPYYLSKIKSISTTGERYVEDLVLEMEHDTSKQKPELEPHDRMYLESFMYNYSVALLWAVDISKLPNPYSVYEVLGKSLKCFVYQCDVRWMNNPVVGAASEAFEILAKVSYIGRLPMPLDKDSIWFKRALQLQKKAYYHTPSILPSTDQPAFEDKVYQNCKANLLVGEIVAKTSFLLISKVIYYKEYDILSCQKTVSEIVENMEKVPKKDYIWGILTWSVIVCGVFTADEENQKKILSYLDFIRDKFHMLPLFNSKLFLFKTWELPLTDRLDILFDRENLNWVTA
ncbi:unnamed protein product [Kluyveromyces dobzhanskii CBS 2104]|uniref:WGS project CCBQ000000000 data, contig 00102 n=1 Tax=Kluyveromyces dobzhanskii CBS 2104 TaxID=1427455 RepID=A0A0A8L467_9SACH|nr:unnamed protein product [Kluyveromyces dobzhanskii CBS 2104]